MLCIRQVSSGNHRLAPGTLLNALWWPCLGQEGTPKNKEGVYTYVQLIPFALQNKLTRHCEATVLQQKSLKNGSQEHVSLEM